MNVLLLRDVLAVLLAGGAGERLYPLTRDRAKPAVTFGGPYRIVDFTLSNCLNSGLRKIYIATQYKAQNLNPIEREAPRWVIILSGDHIYKMDYGKMLDVHIARGASLTVSAIEVPLADARRFGILEVDDD